ncbi:MULTISPECIES: hypothetical protein [Olivibacter]|uniref:HTH cro/C1-type domain-containing protein n=1 Tax=Olivibacter jilunii TaxID=985016 RepID=A0ABW6AXL8_9SPHI
MDKLGFKTQASFAAALGIKSGTMSDILRGKPGVGVSSKIKRVLENTYNVSMDFLEDNIGDVFKTEEPSPSLHKIDTESSKDKIIQLLERTISDKDTIIREKQKIIELLQQQINMLTNSRDKSVG